MSSFTKTATAALTTTDLTTVVAAQGARSFINIHNVILSNQSATATFVDILDGSTLLIREASDPAGLGNNMKFDKPIRLSENSPVKVQANDAVSTVNVTIVYDVEPSGNG